MTDFHKIGADMGDFLRGLLQSKEIKTETQGSAKKYLLVDATEVSQGTSVSLDLQLGSAEFAEVVSRDVVFEGVVQFKSGQTAALQQTVAQNYARALALVPVAGKPDVLHIVADGELQPSAKAPYEVTLHERKAVEGSVVRLTGQIANIGLKDASGIAVVDAAKREVKTHVNFTVTHDPIDFGVIGLVGGLAALICGGVVLIDAILNDCLRDANAQCGTRGVKKITIKRSYGFSWKQGPDVGCGQTCEIECNR
ncbi:hypothetical protein [Bradyrhizobium sp. sBnM-33]|uniref:hypothetical protein n=1 Tax=Bradyrhizobium sp. sBnM-33 TaxID=2831780 RepID=UPI001BCBB6F5|nr:hypothetical protein [Bradyrhizobium sp. sBnM-33]WOH51127.1 hypothetical protein RX328_02110 [Bradyrhizobium sp. sBnM-33]